MEYFKITSKMGGEYELNGVVPSQVAYEKLPASTPYYVHGPWGRIVFQHFQGAGFSVWDSQYFMDCAAELAGSSNQPINELHNSVKNYFTSSWDGIGQPTEKAGQGGFSSNPFVHNEAYFPAPGLYRTFDFHFEKPFLKIYADVYPKLYDLMNSAENKKAGRIDTLLKLDGDMKAIINHISRPDCVAGILPRYFQIKTEEFLIGALGRMHPIKQPRPFTLSPTLKDKAEQLEFILQQRFADPLTLAEIAKLMATNVQFITVAFKQRYGMTIFQYVRKLRLEHAKTLLLNSPRLGLEAIVVETRFHDAPSLVRAFKDLYGLTPGEFRKYGRTK